MEIRDPDFFSQIKQQIICIIEGSQEVLAEIIMGYNFGQYDYEGVIRTSAKLYDDQIRKINYIGQLCLELLALLLSQIKDKAIMQHKIQQKIQQENRHLVDDISTFRQKLEEMPTMHLQIPTFKTVVHDNEDLEKCIQQANQKIMELQLEIIAVSQKYAKQIKTNSQQERIIHYLNQSRNQLMENNQKLKKQQSLLIDSKNTNPITSCSDKQHPDKDLLQIVTSRHYIDEQSEIYSEIRKQPDIHPIQNRKTVLRLQSRNFDYNCPVLSNVDVNRQEKIKTIRYNHKVIKKDKEEKKQKNQIVNVNVNQKQQKNQTVNLNEKKQKNQIINLNEKKQNNQTVNINEEKANRINCSLISQILVCVSNYVVKKRIKRNLHL